MQGAAAWALSVGVEGATVADITTRDTAGALAEEDPAGFRRGGFERSEITTGPGNEGAVSIVVLGFVGPVWLPADGSVRAARLTIASRAPDAGSCSTVRISYTDGRRGSGEAVINSLVLSASTYVPIFPGFSIKFERPGSATAPSRDC